MLSNESVQYFVVIPTGAIRDLAGNSYAGSNTYDFTANASPVATGFSFTTDEDTVGSGSLTGTDADGKLLTFSKIANPTNGAVTINATTGAYTYTPNANFNGDDSFTFKVNDGTVDSETASVLITVTALNDMPTGRVTISGSPTQGQVLTVANTLADLDGLGTISYQWLADGVIISGATSSTHNLTQSQVGKYISVKASYTDLQGTAESVTITATTPVANVNDSPTGSITINGTPKSGQTLTAANTLADADGLGTIGYQWQADGVDISGAIAATYTLTQAEVGKAITAVASYTDAQGTVERVSSAALLVEPSSRLTLTATHWKTGKGALSNVDIGITQDGTRLKTAADGRISAQGFTDPDSVDDGHTVLKPQLGAIGAQASITLTDVLGALKVYLNKPLDAAYDSPYKYIAADFQGDGDVDLSDVLSLLKYYLKKPVDAAPSWVFVDSAHTVTVGGKSLPVSSTTGQALSKSHAAPADIYVHLDSETPLQLIGVLRGDMDGSSA